MKNSQKVRVERQGTKWVVYDLSAPQRKGVPIDAGVLTVTWKRGSSLEGYLMASHGVPQEVAEALNREQLLTLGVGAQHRAGATSGRGLDRINLNEDGSISNWRP